MATKSFLKSVNIKTRKQAKRFINALEKAEQFSKQENVTTNRTAYEVKSENVNEFIKKVRWSD